MLITPVLQIMLAVNPLVKLFLPKAKIVASDNTHLFCISEWKLLTPARWLCSKSYTMPQKGWHWGTLLAGRRWLKELPTSKVLVWFLRWLRRLTLPLLQADRWNNTCQGWIDYFHFNTRIGFKWGTEIAKLSIWGSNMQRLMLNASHMSSDIGPRSYNLW